MEEEKTLVKEWYDNPQTFLDELNSINIRKMENGSDKELIKKLKKWVKTYWDDEGNMKLYRTQYLRLQAILEEKPDKE